MVYVEARPLGRWKTWFLNAALCWHNSACQSRSFAKPTKAARSQKAADGRGFVRVDIKDGIELGDLQQVTDFLREMEKL